MSCAIIFNSNKIELKVHISCYLGLRLTLCYMLQAFIALLYQLEQINDFKVQLEMLQKEYLIEPPEVVVETVSKVCQLNRKNLPTKNFWRTGLDHGSIL